MNLSLFSRFGSWGGSSVLKDCSGNLYLLFPALLGESRGIPTYTSMFWVVPAVSSQLNMPGGTRCLNHLNWSVQPLHLASDSTYPKVVITWQLPFCTQVSNRDRPSHHPSCRWWTQRTMNPYSPVQLEHHSLIMSIARNVEFLVVFCLQVWWNFLCLVCL